MCEMLIRHECCGVGAPGSGGGTPCATSHTEERGDGGALVLQEPPWWWRYVCVENTRGGQELENRTFFSEYKQCVQGSWSCSSQMSGVGMLVFFGEVFFSVGRDYCGASSAGR